MKIAMHAHRSDLCVDANLVIEYAAATSKPPVVNLWRRWARERPRLHAPALLKYEVINGVHRMRTSGMLNTDAAGLALLRAFRLPISFHNDDALHLRAFQLAGAHALPATYDAHYLALAERLGIEFWTSDVRLFKAVGDQLPWVRLVA